jgi:O-antigen ligase
MSTQVEVEGTDEVALEGSAEVRVQTWQAVMRVVSEHPLDGVGFTGLGFVLPQTGENLGVEVKDSAHNTYLRMMGELGILGLALFVFLLWRCWQLAWKTMRAAQNSFDRQIAVGLAGATLGMAVSCWFGDRFFSVLITGNFWMLCALVNDALLEKREARA